MNWALRGLPKRNTPLNLASEELPLEAQSVYITVADSPLIAGKHAIRKALFLHVVELPIDSHSPMIAELIALNGRKPTPVKQKSQIESKEQTERNVRPRTR